MRDSRSVSFFAVIPEYRKLTSNSRANLMLSWGSISLRWHWLFFGSELVSRLLIRT